MVIVDALCHYTLPIMDSRIQFARTTARKATKKTVSKRFCKTNAASLDLAFYEELIRLITEVKQNDSVSNPVTIYRSAIGLL
ncbi:uncharacterized protein CLAFUR5_14648 [Fulvia fulva]|uniref:Uncharacterized protein n=1 Tax=Passalora fulva TaxID=5499 RepID=A0A9Q8UWV9_PASFU|nr:uncharacterized protein CLAFUR5_14648 [Fulvia fulva]KAK4608885.1 hypothetical protein CLAFUR0_14858 [Fulvia fulva]UJO25418.1 hypothetical protein CLAFUR5_14648 [Fulvia fulva]